MIVLALTTTLAAGWITAGWWWTRTLVDAIATADIQEQPHDRTRR